MPWSRRFFLGLLGMGAMSLPVACGRRADTTADRVSIGLLVPLTGPNSASTGQPTIQGAELAVQQFNAAGGLTLATGGTAPIALAIADTTDSPDQAVAATRKLIAEQNVVAILGLPISRTAIAVAQFLETVPLPVLSTTSTNPQTTAGKRYVFRTCFVDDLQGLVLAEFARTELLATTAAVLYDVSSAYNRGLAENFARAFGELGGRMVGTETYTSDRAVNFREQLQRLKTAAPDVLMLPNYIDDVYRQAAQIHELGIPSTLLGGDTWDDFRLNPKQGLLDGNYYTAMWYPDRAQAIVLDFLKAYETAYGSPPNGGAALAYDACNLLLTVLQNQKSTAPDAIRSGLATFQGFEGVSGSLSFNGTGDPARSVVVVQIRQGQIHHAKTVG